MNIQDSDTHSDVRFAQIINEVKDHTCSLDEVERVLRAAYRKGWHLHMAYTIHAKPVYPKTSDGETK